MPTPFVFYVDVNLQHHPDPGREQEEEVHSLHEESALESALLKLAERRGVVMQVDLWQQGGGLTWPALADFAP